MYYYTYIMIHSLIFLGPTDYRKFKRYRESEVKHGRIAMLAGKCINSINTDTLIK